jgi:hypothetical protein
MQGESIESNSMNDYYNARALHRRSALRMTNLHKLARQSMRCMVLAPAIVLGACSNYEAMRDAAAYDEQANTVYPQNYKAEIVSFMRTYLNDPTQVRDAHISDPIVKTADSASRYIVCVRYNAKKSGGQYAGRKDSVVTFRQGRLDRIIDSGRDPRAARETREVCKDVAMKPFIELEQLTR